MILCVWIEGNLRQKRRWTFVSWMTVIHNYMSSQAWKAMVNICLFNCHTKHKSNRLTPTPYIKLVNQLFYTMIVIARSLRLTWTDILYIGKSSLDLGKQTVGKTTCRPNDRMRTRVHHFDPNFWQCKSCIYCKSCVVCVVTKLKWLRKERVSNNDLLALETWLVTM